MNLYGLQRSLIAKTLMHVVVITLVSTGIFAVLPFEIELEIMISCVAGISLLYLLFMYFHFIRPVKIILHEMKALLTGKRYRRIMTDRVDEIGVIGHFFNEITQNLERISTDLNEHKRMSKELNVAHQIQQNLLPSKAPDIQELDIIAKTKPAEEIGGDCFDFIETEDDLFFYLGDVTGHGVPAGLVMIMVDTLLDTFVDKGMNTKDVLINTNKYLKPKISTAMFMTMVMFRWDKKNQKLYYTGAGHEHILIYRQSTHRAESFPAGGIALGMVPDNSEMLEEKEIDFEAGDAIILYTDGITEGENAHGEQYGLKRLSEITEKCGSLPSSELMFNRLSEHFSAFLEGHIQDDDMSLMVIRRTN